MRNNLFKKIILIAAVFALLNSCYDAPQKIKSWTKINYKEFIKRFKRNEPNQVDLSDTSNVLDKNEFNPAMDSLSDYLDDLSKVLKKDSVMVEELGLDDSSSFTKQITDTSNFAKNDTFTNQIKKIQPAEIEALKFNLEQIVASDSANKVITNSKRQIERIVWARINKTDQRLYLYLDGQIVDTFKVSTGDKKHETPLMDRQPTGPIFQKYTSKKYPGGNYNGLGNMPHVVFVQGGYGIHGTTRDNIPRLGKKASHGCIRLHPDNAKIFNELVRKVGLNNTWVTIEN